MKKGAGVYHTSLKGFVSVFRQSTPLLLCLLLFACEKKQLATADPGKPKRSPVAYFDKKLLLEKLPASFYDEKKPGGSFNPSDVSNVYTDNGLQVEFLPIGYSPDNYFQYTQAYNSKCAPNTRDSIWELTYVGFPDRCVTQDSAYAKVRVKNISKQNQHYFFRLFWQNTSYWSATDSSMNYAAKNYLNNYYNGSVSVEANIAAGADTTLLIPYTIGRIRKHQYMWLGSKDRACPGNYEFMLLWDKSKSHLMNERSDFYITNPFAEIQNRYRQNKNTPLAYVPATHFKFVFLEEYFDGTNDLNPNHYFYVKRNDEKKLCDTCSGWFKNIISEHWNTKEFFEGFIAKAGYVKADFGNRLENTTIDERGITMTIPASKRGSYQKTWGEFLFVPSFKYGHVTIRAKFSQMYNFTGTPNGIVHNLWLFQRDRDVVDTTNPYHHFVNYDGLQPYEIDFEIWSSQTNVNSEWDNNAFINYSIVDYMRNAKAEIKPGEEKTFGKYKANRFNNRQINIPSEPLPADFFDSFHTYELYWHPDRVEFLVDGKEVGVITKDMAAIPDKYMFLWVGSPIYQDGTYYEQSSIPFLKYPQQSVVDYIKID